MYCIYAVALAVCVGWAWRLSREAKQRDDETTGRRTGRRKNTIQRIQTPEPKRALISRMQ